jgi:hypothetical protein
MNTERWDELGRLFADLQGLPAEARADFITRTCGGRGA